jgi:hypothetical protein
MNEQKIWNALQHSIFSVDVASGNNRFGDFILKFDKT